MQEFLNLTQPAPLALDTLAINLLLSIVFSGLIGAYYSYYGRSLSNRAQLAQILPVLSLITVLVISIVKSSLALSLGLVGALSIVRFRTAIKEPEELIYLFMALAVGLGLGADQRWPTALAVVIIFGYLLVRALLLPPAQQNNLYVNIYSPQGEGNLAQLNQLLLSHVNTADIQRIDTTPEGIHASYLIKITDDATLAQLMEALRSAMPNGEFSFVEHSNSLLG